MKVAFRRRGKGAFSSKPTWIKNGCTPTDWGWRSQTIIQKGFSASTSALGLLEWKVLSMYLFCKPSNLTKLTKTFEIRLTSRKSNSVIYKWAPYLGTLLCKDRVESRLEEGATKTTHVITCERNLRWHISWGLLVGNRQEEWPSAVRHPLRTACLPVTKLPCTGCGETQWGTIHWHLHLHTSSNFFCFTYNYFIYF